MLSYDHTTTAASAMVTLISVAVATVDTRSAATRASHHGSACLLLLVVLPYLTDEVAERLVDVNALLSRCLDELAAEVLCKVTALIHSNLSLILEIALVSHDNDRERILILNTEDLLMESANFLKRIAGGDRVNEEEAFTSAHVLLAHSPVFLLTSRVEDVEQRDLIIDDALLAVRVLNCRVVFVDEMALNELDSEGRFTDTTPADNYQLILPQELSPRHSLSSKTRKIYGLKELA